MIINDLNLIWSRACPLKTDAILVVDSNAILASTISSKFFKLIAWWDTQFLEYFDRVKLIQFPSGNSPNVGGASSPGFGRVHAIKDIFSTFGFEVLDHEYIITRIVYYRKADLNDQAMVKYEILKSKNLDAT
jgi:hypothetical protein